MSRPDGRQQRAIQDLATALNECFDAASESTAARAAEKAAESAAERAAASVKAELKADMNAMEGRLIKRMDDRLDRQDDTLRMIWTQCGGTARRLPIDT